MVEGLRVSAGGGGVLFVLVVFILITFAWGCFILSVCLTVKHFYDLSVSYYYTHVFALGSII